MRKEQQFLSIVIEAPKRFSRHKKKYEKRALSVSLSEIADFKGIKKHSSLLKVINIRLVTDAAIKKINREYLSHNRATDVVSFSYLDDLRKMNKNDKRAFFVVGDIVVSHEMARRRCREYGNTFEKELSLYIIHGILHVFEYDDTEEKARSLMLKKQESYLNTFFPK